MANKKTQVNAVIDAVNEVLGDRFTPRETIVSATLSKEARILVVNAVKNSIVNGETSYNKSIDDDTKLYQYVRGMVGNHLKRSPILNGGVSQKKKTSLPAELEALT